MSASARIFVLILLLCLLPSPCAGQRISTLIVGEVSLLQALRQFFDNEPLVLYETVVCRGGASTEELRKNVRLYFPRTYSKMKSFDAILLVSADYTLLSPIQDKWIYDALAEGAGGINDGSLFSIVTDVTAAWMASQSQRAFPNDVEAVVRQQWRVERSFSVKINPNARYAILTPFMPYGVEEVSAYSAHGLVVAREGAETLAWQTGFPGKPNAGYIVAWEHEGGRSITTGDFLANGWLGYPSFGGSGNQYSPDILVSMILWISKRRLIDSVDVFHSIKGVIAEFKTRYSILMSLRDFIEKFGANTDRIREEMARLEDFYEQGTQRYVDQEFESALNELQLGLRQFPQAEAIAQKVKASALLWIYVIEWAVTSSALFISGFLLWTLMVRRRVYREVASTRLFV